ncbi:DUF1441 family protein [Undibacterium sp. Di26W]|uniref:DUF1441 family protein n=1 Tax=Undibacterium sp. Di26W TaxID=3413035 RepID=UPI003BF033DA
MHGDDDFSDLIGPPTTKPNNGHGGKREGGGGRTKRVRTATEDNQIAYAKSRALHEEQKAKLAELEYNIKSGKYLLREDVQRATATAFATVSQTLRSIPDNLERQLNLAPEVAEQVGIQIDEVMGLLAEELEALNKSNMPELIQIGTTDA